MPPEVAFLLVVTLLGVEHIHFPAGEDEAGAVRGVAGGQTVAAMSMMAQVEGLFLDPVHTAKTFAGALGLLRQGCIKPGARVLFDHTGGQPALFACLPEIDAKLTSDS